jgi:hypothetical protein
MRAAAAPAAAAAALMLYACASTGTGPRAAPSLAAERPAPPAADADWHALVIVPFGTLLKDVPFHLAEVVVFHDSAADGGHEDRDCYTLQGRSPPAFFGRPVDEYSLCFSSDRLNRIEASVRLPAESAAAQFAAGCAAWQRGGTPGTAASDHCAARDGGTEVEARLTAGEPIVSISVVGSSPSRDAGT